MCFLLFYLSVVQFKHNKNDTRKKALDYVFVTREVMVVDDVLLQSCVFIYFAFVKFYKSFYFYFSYNKITISDGVKYIST